MRTMVELFSGYGEVSAEFRRRGWRTERVEIDECFDILWDRALVADVECWVPPALGPVDFMWASPPCTEFSKFRLPFFDKSKLPPPSFDLVNAVLRIRRQLRPRFWVMENVYGLQYFIGAARQHAGSFYLWGDFPLMPTPPRCSKGMNTNFRGPGFVRRPELRARIPEALARAIADSVEMGLEAAATPV